MYFDQRFGKRKTLRDADVCIEFTNPQAAFSNIKKIAVLGKNMVIGTTGWDEYLTEAENLAAENKVGIVYGSNFSIGMNAFFEITEFAANLFDKLTEYDVFGFELHHNRKVDSPSGTAKILSEIVLKNMERKNRFQFDRVNRKIEADEFHFASIRAGNIPGIHTVGFDSEADTIELKHTVRNREGLALGALKAAEWINGKTGFFNFRDIFRKMVLQEK
ncbi:MAG: 4-hydroxy-tetrahydrodipicolinate reductase [Candidatus Cloacimonas sp. 4484_275]|nr:MAG: 4-hydroxy-tetrahydrodipicolinate reductase [Candidatus Cloacimonas sp. 4484_275]